MDVYEAIEKRRTIRIFKQGVSEEQLKKIILAGTMAPSSGNRQPWEFIIIDDPKIIDQIAELKYQQNRLLSSKKGDGPEGAEQRALKQKEYFQNVSIVAVCSMKDKIEKGQGSTSWLCIENMSLAAFADGVGSTIVTYWDKYKEEVEKVLGLPEDYELTAVMKFGVPGEQGFSRDKNPIAPRRPEFSWIHKNKF